MLVQENSYVCVIAAIIIKWAMFCNLCSSTEREELSLRCAILIKVRVTCHMCCMYMYTHGWCHCSVGIFIYVLNLVPQRSHTHLFHPHTHTHTCSTHSTHHTHRTRSPWLESSHGWWHSPRSWVKSCSRPGWRQQKRIRGIRTSLLN